eukprot:s1571_g1.t1
MRPAFADPAVVEQVIDELGVGYPSSGTARLITANGTLLIRKAREISFRAKPMSQERPAAAVVTGQKRNQNKPVRSHKVVFLGQSGTGKTSLIRQFVYRTFEPCYQATVGMDFVSKLVTLEGGQKIRLQLWDTAGQERFRALVPSYLRDSSVCVIVYDVTSRESFDSIHGWVEQVLEDRSRKEVILALVGNKIDLEVTLAQFSFAAFGNKNHFRGLMRGQWEQEPEASGAFGSKEVLQRAGSNEWSMSSRPTPILSRKLWRAPDLPTLSSCLPGATLDSPEPFTLSDGSAKQIWPPLHEEVQARDEVCDDCSGSDEESVQIFKEYALGQLQIWIKTTADRRVQHSEGRAMAEELKMLFFEASSCKPDLVDAVFNGIAEGLSADPKAESDDEIVLEPQRHREASHRRKKCC